MTTVALRDEKKIFIGVKNKKSDKKYFKKIF